MSAHGTPDAPSSRRVFSEMHPMQSCSEAAVGGARAAGRRAAATCLHVGAPVALIARRAPRASYAGPQTARRLRVLLGGDSSAGVRLFEWVPQIPQVDSGQRPQAHDVGSGLRADSRGGRCPTSQAKRELSVVVVASSAASGSLALGAHC